MRPTRNALASACLAGLFVACGGGETPPPPPPPPAWTPVGVAGFSAGGISNLFFDADDAGVLYVAFADAANGDRATVMKYAAGAWTPVGAPGFSPGLASLCIHAGAPHVALIDGGNATVMRFDGAGWTIVGEAAFADAVTAMALGSDGSALYAVMKREAPPPVISALVTGMTFGGSAWTTLPNFYGASLVPNKPFALDVSNGKLHLAHRDYPQLGNGIDQLAVVSTYDVAQGTLADIFAQWVTSNDAPEAIADSGSVLYWACFNDGRLGMYRKTPGVAAQQIPSPYTAGTTAGDLALAADADGAYVAYTASTVSGRLVVKRFSGGTWLLVGIEGFSADTANFLQLRVVNGTPHVAFQDGATGKATVMKFM